MTNETRRNERNRTNIEKGRGDKKRQPSDEIAIGVGSFALERQKRNECETRARNNAGQSLEAVNIIHSLFPFQQFHC